MKALYSVLPPAAKLALSKKLKHHEASIGYSWLDGLLRNPWSGVQTPQVLGYSGLRVAEPLVRDSNPYGAGVSLCSRGWGPTCPIRVHLAVDTGKHTAKEVCFSIVS